jgi:hypothetical protein
MNELPKKYLPPRLTDWKWRLRLIKNIILGRPVVYRITFRGSRIDVRGRKAILYRNIHLGPNGVEIDV